MTNWEKLLGGYATGTLTGEERAALMQAALRDQALFDVLMDEEALRETLADPATRSALLRALDPAAKAVAWWRNPWPWTGLGAVAAAVALVVVLRPVDPPVPVQMAQNRPATVAPQPVPSEIKTPQRLRTTQPEVAQKQVAPKAAVQDEASARQLTFATGPSPAPAVEAAERDEPAKARANAPAATPAAPAPAAPAPAAPALIAKKKEDVAERIADPLAVALFDQAEDGAWSPLDLASAVPANRPLRLQVTSAQEGLLALQPPIAEARPLVAGIPATIALPAQPAGTLRLRLGLFPRGPQALGRVANELRESKSAALSAADAATPAKPSLTREIRLRIE